MAKFRENPDAEDDEEEEQEEKELSDDEDAEVCWLDLYLTFFSNVPYGSLFIISASHNNTYFCCRNNLLIPARTVTNK